MAKKCLSVSQVTIWLLLSKSSVVSLPLISPPFWQMEMGQPFGHRHKPTMTGSCSMVKNSPWKCWWNDMEWLPSFKFGKPSISMGHLYHGYVSHNQRVNASYHWLSLDSAQTRPNVSGFLEPHFNKENCTKTARPGALPYLKPWIKRKTSFMFRGKVFFLMLGKCSAKSWCQCQHMLPW